MKTSDEIKLIKLIKSREIYEVIKLSPTWTQNPTVFAVGTKFRLINGLLDYSENSIGWHPSDNFYTVCREGIEHEWLGIEKDCVKQFNGWAVNDWIDKVLK